MKGALLLLLTLMVLGGCKLQKSHESDIIQGVIVNGKDTIIVDQSGNPVIVNFNERLEEIEMSINGKVFYSYPLNQDQVTYDKHGNILKSVYKTEFMNKDFRIFINDDTLNVGESFRGIIWANKEKYSIQLQEPKKEIVKGDEITDSYTFEQTCEREGVFSFKGKIEYDSGQVFPFEYRYLVK